MKRSQFKWIFFLIAIVPFWLNGQTSPHVIFGIDLNENWTTLTNQSAFSYISNLNITRENNYVGVAMDLSEKYIQSSADPELIEIGFTSTVLLFPEPAGSINEFDIETCTPGFLIASLEYETDFEYEQLNEGVFTNLASLIMKQFGVPSSMMKKDWGASFTWTLTNSEIILNTSKTQHIVLVYQKKKP